MSLINPKWVSGLQFGPQVGSRSTSCESAATPGVLLEDIMVATCEKSSLISSKILCVLVVVHQYLPLRLILLQASRLCYTDLGICRADMAFSTCSPGLSSYRFRQVP